MAPLFQNNASFKEGAALNSRGGYVSFESSNYPNYYIRHRNFELWLDQMMRHGPFMRLIQIQK